MLKWTVRALVVLALALSAVTCAVAQAPEKISQIYLEGNRRVDRDTVLSLIHTRTGDPYDAKTLQQDVETLELSKYFRSVRLESNDDPHDPNAKIVSFRLIEWPIIESIEYSGLGSISPSDIADGFKRRDVDLAVGGFFSPAALLDAQSAIWAVLARHGYPAAQVKVAFESVPVRGTNAVNLTFTVTEGPANSH